LGAGPLRQFQRVGFPVASPRYSPLQTSPGTKVTALRGQEHDLPQQNNSRIKSVA
jgi:hypothetical protein